MSKLLAQREPSGARQVYYHCGKEGVNTASGFREMLDVIGEPVNISPSGINAYLHYDYTAAPLTVIDGVYSLQPGYKLIQEDDSTITTQRYYTMENAEPLTGPINPAEIIREKLLNAVNKCVKLLNGGGGHDRSSS